jgi:hypothetical protein
MIAVPAVGAAKEYVMKRVLFLGLLFCAVALSLPAKGFYFDLGLGSGAATTKVDGNKVSRTLGFSEVVVDLGMKAGYGPFDKLPLYAVADIAALGHRFDNGGGDYLQFNTYLIGPGVIVYPVRCIQLAASAGYSFTANQSSLSTAMYNSKPGGFGGSVSAALDVGKGKNTCLLGLKFSGATNTLEVSNVKQDTSLVGIFFRSARRDKAASA